MHIKNFRHDIFYIENFISDTECDSFLEYLNNEGDDWNVSAFYGSLGKGISDSDDNIKKYGLPVDFVSNLRKRMHEVAEEVFDKTLKPNTSHAQKFITGGYANPHSDNTDIDGRPNAFQINKYVSLLYLNDDYTGGYLYFPDHSLDLKPPKGILLCFPGGMENVHAVSTVESGERTTMMAFWDYADAEYSEELRKEWEEEIKIVREIQEKRREQWEKQASQESK